MPHSSALVVVTTLLTVVASAASVYEVKTWAKPGCSGALVDQVGLAPGSCVNSSRVSWMITPSRDGRQGTVYTWYHSDLDVRDTLCPGKPGPSFFFGSLGSCVDVPAMAGDDPRSATVVQTSGSSTNHLVELWTDGQCKGVPRMKFVATTGMCYRCVNSTSLYLEDLTAATKYIDVKTWPSDPRHVCDTRSVYDTDNIPFGWCVPVWDGALGLMVGPPM